MVDVEQLEEGAGNRTVTFEWDPVPADWGNALRAFYLPYRWAGWLSVPLAAFSIVLLVTGQLVAGLIGLGACLLAAAIPPAQVWVSFRRHPGAGKTMTGEADGSSIRIMVIDGTGRTELRWDRIAGWKPTRLGFVLRTWTSDGGDGGVYPVPRRAFSTPQDRDRFQALLERHAGTSV